VPAIKPVVAEVAAKAVVSAIAKKRIGAVPAEETVPGVRSVETVGSREYVLDRAPGIAQLGVLLERMRIPTDCR